VQVHLKRFEYDVESGSMRKLQQAFSFPTRLSLARFMAESARNGAGAPPPEYELHAVLSHGGDAGSGHYIAYVRPRGTAQWWEFDDTRVRQVEEHVAVKQQFGGRHSPVNTRNGGGLFGFGGGPMNAYMLVYVRRDLIVARDGAGAPSSSAATAASPAASGDVTEPRLGDVTEPRSGDVTEPRSALAPEVRAAFERELGLRSRRRRAATPAVASAASARVAVGAVMGAPGVAINSVDFEAPEGEAHAAEVDKE
jgi:hypothetical protein